MTPDRGSQAGDQIRRGVGGSEVLGLWNYYGDPRVGGQTDGQVSAFVVHQRDRLPGYFLRQRAMFTAADYAQGRLLGSLEPVLEA